MKKFNLMLNKNLLKQLCNEIVLISRKTTWLKAICAFRCFSLLSLGRNFHDEKVTPFCKNFALPNKH